MESSTMRAARSLWSGKSGGVDIFVYLVFFRPEERR